MTQQKNQLQNNRSVFRTVVAFIVPKTGPIHLVLVGTAGRQTKAVLKSLNTVVLNNDG